MNVKSLILISLLALPAAYSQSTDPGPKQDMKNAGSDTKHAATNAGHGVSPRNPKRLRQNQIRNQDRLPQDRERNQNRLPQVHHGHKKCRPQG